MKTLINGLKMIRTGMETIKVSGCENVEMMAMCMKAMDEIIQILKTGEAEEEKNADN